MHLGSSKVIQLVLTVVALRSCCADRPEGSSRVGGAASRHFGLGLETHTKRKDEQPLVKQPVVAAAEKPRPPAAAPSGKDFLSTGDGPIADNEARLNRLVSWGHARGIIGAENLQAVAVHAATNSSQKVGWGLSSKLLVKTGGTVLSVPSNLLLWSRGERTEAMFRAAGLAPRVLPSTSADRQSRSESRLLLAAGLLALRDNSSDWEGYLRNLPTIVDYSFFHPSAGRDQLLDVFQELPVSGAIRNQRQERQGRWEEFSSRGGRASRDAWEWSELTVMTRNWQGPKGVGHMLAPVADALRPAGPYDSNVVVEQGNPDAGIPFVLRATKNIPAGAELLVDYGRIPDDQFLSIWGFTPGRFAPARLPPAACLRLATVDGVQLVNSTQESCRAPASEPQKAAFCSLAALASEQCGGSTGETLAQLPTAMNDLPLHRHPIVKALLVVFLAMLAARQLYWNRSSQKMASMMAEREGSAYSRVAGILSKRRAAAGMSANAGGDDGGASGSSSRLTFSRGAQRA